MSLTLTEVHADHVLLRDYLGGQCRPGQSVADAWQQYVRAGDKRRTQSHHQLVKECLRAEFKMSRGSLDDARHVLAGKYPAMYSMKPPSVFLSGLDLQAEMKRRKIKIADLVSTLGVSFKDVTQARKNGVPDGAPWLAALEGFPIPLPKPAKKRSVITKIAAAIVWLCLLILGEAGSRG